ncbi:MAG: hypothetical protein LJE94_00210 [Deltaproteobacteria bacterium]|nr:hypothetical protein [Deltaproteobacteria bacterium]
MRGYRRRPRALRTRGAPVFFPAGNTIAMPTADLAAICRYCRKAFPELRRITVYGSSAYIVEKGLDDIRLLKKAGLSRIHVGLESGDDVIPKRVKKGANAAEQIRAGQIVKRAGMHLNDGVRAGR